jgi:hypothetical protein
MRITYTSSELHKCYFQTLIIPRQKGNNQLVLYLFTLSTIHKQLCETLYYYMNLSCSHPLVDAMLQASE